MPTTKKTLSQTRPATGAHKPSGFARSVLGLEQYDWQIKFLDSLMPLHSQRVLRAANGSGKTTNIAGPLAIWHACMFKGSTTILTSGAWRQVTEQLMPRLRRWARQLEWKDRENSIITPEGSRIIGFSTDDPGKFEGWHAEDHGTQPLLIIIDEGKTVKREIFQAAARCQPTRFLAMSSPGAPIGGFFDISRRDEFKELVVTSAMCPHITERDLAMMEALCGGKDTLAYRSMAYAEWMANEGQMFVVSNLALRYLLDNPPKHVDGPNYYAVDFARSKAGDENVIAALRGNKVTIESAFVGNGDAVAVCDRIAAALHKAGAKPEECYGDADGLGADYISILRRKGWPIQEYRASERANTPVVYRNMGSEAWFNCNRRIEDRSIILPDDPILFKHLTERLYDVDDKGRLCLQSKEEMSYSPDRGDAVTMLFARNKFNVLTGMEQPAQNEFDKLFPPNEGDGMEAVFPGFSVGF